MMVRSTTTFFGVKRRSESSRVLTFGGRFYPRHITAHGERPRCQHERVRCESQRKQRHKELYSSRYLAFDGVKMFCRSYRIDADEDVKRGGLNKFT